ncbi:MAG TPA: maleylpyruvate isomerase N-terminal domain-containing protein, partial [Pedococcus sp.]
DHLGRVHLWAAAAARTGEEPRPYPRRDTSQPLTQWYAACVAELVDTLAGLSPEQPAWTFFGPDQRVGFWRRRQVHETAVHLVDLLQATGELPTWGLVTALPHLSSGEAADGVDEVLRVMAPRKLERLAPRPPEELVPAPRPVAFAAGGSGRSWTLRLGRGEVRVEEGESEDAVARVSAPAAHLYLALWGRADRRELAVEGDQAAVGRLLDAGLVP